MQNVLKVEYPVKPILGQEALCPDGLGRVSAFSFDMPHVFIQVETYDNNRACKWDLHNVRLVPFETVPVVIGGRP